MAVDDLARGLSLKAIKLSEEGSKGMQSDWDQTDESSPDYIKNKPDFKKYVDDSIANALGIVETELDNIINGGN